MASYRAVWLGIAAVGVTAASAALSAPVRAPALLTNPTSKGRSELHRVVSRALHGASVRLADDALTHESVLLVDRVQPLDAAGRLLNGREFGKPERFELTTDGKRCFLSQESTGKTWVLTAVTCTRAAIG